MLNELIYYSFVESAELKKAFIEENKELLREVFEEIARRVKSGKKILLCGNGGSAADAQHIAGELVGRFQMERKALPAIALTTDTSILTAVGNDYSFDKIFERQVEALGEEGDVLIGISTSGNSPNVINAVLKAKKLGMFTVGFSGKDGGKLKEVADVCFVVKSFSTPRIQEVHITIGHVMCDFIEKFVFKEEGKNEDRKGNKA
jgi:D-sedoheptulose 7-phosphate isomerase